MTLSLDWGLGDPPLKGKLLQGSLEEGRVLVEFSPTDRSWFEKHGDIWYESFSDGLEEDPVNIQEET